MRSASALPDAGAHRMPQQLCAQLMNAPSYPGTGPITGSASVTHGRMHVCVFFGPFFPTLALSPLNDALAAFTRLTSVVTRAALSRSPPGLSLVSSTYSDPPHPHMYTSPVLRGYTSRWHALAFSGAEERGGLLRNRARRVEEQRYGFYAGHGHFQSVEPVRRAATPRPHRHDDDVTLDALDRVFDIRVRLGFVIVVMTNLDPRHRVVRVQQHLRRLRA